uniref:Uncharacterized protein n=1 Tax=Populus alba TaxID=43335 RepID=A0A4U5QB61_POPAL|nr:hypothetical protein D5086_0000110700 [Populus alba]
MDGREDPFAEWLDDHNFEAHGELGNYLEFVFSGKSATLFEKEEEESVNVERVKNTGADCSGLRKRKGKYCPSIVEILMVERGKIKATQINLPLQIIKGRLMRVAFTWSRVEVLTKFNLDQRIVDHQSSFTGTALSFSSELFSAADCNILCSAVPWNLMIPKELKK